MTETVNPTTQTTGNDGLKQMIRDMYSVENPEKGKRLNDQILDNIISTYGGDYKEIVKGLYANENPEKGKRLDDTVFSNISQKYGFETKQPEISASASLHSSIPYVFVDENNQENNQIVNSIPATNKDISFDESKAVKVGDELKIENIIPQSETNTQQYFDKAIKDTGGATITKEREKGSFGGELVDQTQSGSESLLAATYGAPGYIYDFIGSGFRALGVDVPLWKDSWGKQKSVLGVDVNPMSFLEKQKNNLLKMAVENDNQVRKANPDIDKGIIDLFEKGEVQAGLRNVFSSIAQSAPSSIAMMATGGMSVPSQIGLGAAVFGSQNMNQADQTGDYGNVSRDALLAINGVTGSFESAFETVLGSGAAGKAITNLIKSKGKAAVTKEIRDEISSTFSKMIIENPWLAPFGESFEEMGTQLSQNIVNKYTGYKPDIKISDGVVDSGIVGFVMGAGQGGLVRGVQKGLSSSKSSENTNQEQPNQPQQPLNTDGTQFTVDPRSQFEMQQRQRIAPFKDIDSGNLRMTTVQTPGNDENIPAFIIKEVAGVYAEDGRELIKPGYLVAYGDENNNQQIVGKDEIGQIEEQTEDDYIGNQLAQYDANEQNKELIKQNMVSVDGKQYVLSGQQDKDGYEAIDPESGESIIVPSKTVEQAKGIYQETGNTSNVVKRVYGKTNVTGIQDEQGNISVSDPATLEQANNLKEEVERETNGKSTVVATELPNEDPTAPVMYQLSIVPNTNVDTSENNVDSSAENVDTSEPVNPELKAQVEKETAPSYSFKGNPIDKKKALSIISIASDIGGEAGKNKLAGLQYANDPEIDALIEKTWPKPKAKFRIGNKIYDNESAITYIEMVDTPEELARLKHENIEAAPEVLQAYTAKQAEFEAIAKEEKAKADEIHNKLVKAVNDFNSMTDGERRKASTHPIAQQAANLGYLTRMDGSKIIVTDKGKEIGYRGRNTPLDIIKQHKALTDYSPEVQNTAKYFLTPMAIQDVDLNGLHMDKAKDAILDIHAGKKSVDANYLLDQIEKIHNSGVVKIKSNNKTGFPGAEIPFNEYIALMNEDQLAENMTDEQADFILNMDENDLLDTNTLIQLFYETTGTEPDIKQPEETTGTSQAEAGSAQIETPEPVKEYTDEKPIKQAQPNQPGQNTNQGEITPQEKQGQGVNEGLEENVNQNIESVSPVVGESFTPGNSAPLINETSKTKNEIDQAVSEVNTNPTDAQKAAGNYKMAHVTVQGMDISIENPKGSFRRGTDEDGKAWETEMKSHYGYFKQTTGKDGDHIDTFIGENPESKTVFVVDQNNPKTGQFDESKVMLGYNSAEEAKAAYLSNYEPGWKGFGSITPVSVEEFKTWLYDGARQRKPFAEYESTPSPIQEKPAIELPLNKVLKAGKKEVEKWDVEFTDGNTKNGTRLSDKTIESVDIYSDTVFNANFTDGGIFQSLNVGNLKGMLSIAKQPIKIAVILDGKLSKDAPILARMQRIANASDAIIAENPDKSRSERQFPYLFVPKSLKGEYQEAELFKTKIQNSSYYIGKEIAEQALSDGSFEKQINEGRNKQEIIDILNKYDIEIPEFLKQQNNPSIQEEAPKNDQQKQQDNPNWEFGGEKQQQKKQSDYGSKNKIVSKERAEELRKRLRDKLNNLNSGFDPEVLAIGTELAAYHIEAGARKFADFSKAMIEDIGGAIKPYLKAIYNGARDLPGMEELEYEMTPYDEVRKTDIDKVLKPVENNQGNDQKDIVESKQSEPENVKSSNKKTNERPLQRNNKRVSKPELPSLFDRVDPEQRTGGSTGLQGAEVSGPDGTEQQPAGREGNVLPGNADVLNIEPALVEFNAEDNDTRSFNPTQKYNDNIKAIETVISLISEKRKATPDEKEILSRYVGFGGLKDVLLNPDNAEGWTATAEKYRPLVKRIIELSDQFDQVTGTKGSLNSIKGSILNAHYTSSNVIRSIYEGLNQLGFHGGRILEPSAGIGNFVTFMPNFIKGKSNITAVELDDLTGQVLKYLHDDVNVKVKGIQDAGIPNNSQDLVISNIPFGNYKIFDKAFKGEKEQFQNRIHNYFFAKAVDMAREGGIIAFVTSKGVLDAPGNENLRRYLDQQTEFLGAVRLPNSAFKNNANTEVVTDIIFLRKNATIEKNNPNFINVFKVNATHRDGAQQEVNVNQYFVDHPENMLGNIVAGGLYSREDYTVENKTGYDLTEAIKKALPTNVYKPVSSDMGLQANDRQETIDAIKEGNINFTGDLLVRKEEGQLVELKINEPTPKIQHYIKLRNALMNLIYSEYLGKGDAELNTIRRNLNNEYDTFVKKYGRLDKSASKIAKQDADGYNVLSLEVKDKPDGKADIFRQRTIQPLQNKLTAESIDEAIVVSLYEHAAIDIERIAQLMNLSIPEVLEKAKGKLFEQPTGGFVTRDEYLSGNVKKKLKEAQQAVADGNTEFQYNVDELQNVIPKDIPAMNIEARLGSRWIPAKVFSDFAKFLFNTPNAEITYIKSIDDYSNNGRIATVEATSKYGTSRRNGADILIDALRLSPPKIYDKIYDKQVLNVEETAKANEKYEEIRQVFEDWVYRDGARRDLLGRIYNDKYNTSIARQYNGDHLNISGINGVSLRKHQKDAIWMLLQNNGGIIDHLVGAGKTYVMVAGTMEMKRTGIAKKPMIIALKSTIPQIVESYRNAFPMAKVLAPMEKDFTKENRNKLFAQIANNEWDCIIMSHENYGKIPHELEIQQKFIQDEMAEVEAERVELDAAGNKRALKGLEVRLKNLEARLDKLNNLDKDNSITFEQMGIDHIMVDESQQFKNLSYVTKQRDVAGLSKAEGSKRAFNLFIGVRYLQQKYGADKGITFLSGTPISNSMVEMYLLLKYLRPNKMNELGFNSFDAWATTFASPSSDIEFTVTGNFKQKNRFREFINVPELSMLYREIADIRTDANTPLDKPKMKGEGYTVVNIKMSKDQKRYGRKLMRFAKTKDGSHIGMVLSDNQKTAAMLLATNLSSKMAIDMRLVNPSYAYDPNGKIARLVENVANTYHETDQHKGTQLIFSDLGTPKNRTNKTSLLRDYMEDELGTNMDTLNELFGDPNESGYKLPAIGVVKDRMRNVLELSDAEIETILEESENSVGSFNVYDEVKKRLIEKGIPEDQVVFIHDYNSQRAKEKLFKEVQQGNIRIVLGSTQKLGTGVNVQDRIVAMHHLDVPWTPAAMEQRNGRGIRQGNWVAKNHLGNEVPVYAYATELTLDAYKYQLLDTKQRFLDQVKSGDTTERVARESDGDSESGVGYAELVAMMSGNKDFLLKNKLEQKIDKLKRSKRNFQSEVYETERSISSIEQRIPEIEKNIRLSEENVEKLTNSMPKDKAGRMDASDVDGKKLSNIKDEKGKERPAERTDYAKEAIQIIQDKLSKEKQNNKIDILTISGYKIVGYRTDNSGDLFTPANIHLWVKADNGVEYSVNFSHIPGIFLNNIQKAIDNIPDLLSMQQNTLERNKLNLESYRELLKKGKEWEKEQELTDSTNELKEVNKRLNESNKFPAQRAKKILDDYKENGGNFDTFVDQIESTDIESINDGVIEKYYNGIAEIQRFSHFNGYENEVKRIQNKLLDDLTTELDKLVEKEQQALEDKKDSPTPEQQVNTEPDRSVPLMDVLDNGKQVTEIKQSQEQEEAKKTLSPVKEESNSNKLLPVEEFKHTKTGQILYNVKINGHSDLYDHMVTVAKRHNPHDKRHPFNTRFSKGFLFEKKEDAERFMNAINGSDKPQFRIIGETGAANLDKAEEATTRLDNLAVAKEMESGQIENPNSIQEYVTMIEKNTGLKFKKSDTTNSYYYNSNDLKIQPNTPSLKIRISDHPSKYVEKQKGTAERIMDIDFSYNVNAISDLINNKLFSAYKKGDRIIHSYSKIGELKFVKYIPELEVVEVVNENGETKKYYQDRFFNDSYKFKQYTPKEIRLATGWEKGVDGLWRYEVPDGELKISIEDALNYPKQDGYYSEEIPLTDVLQDDQLFQAYPQLKETKVVFYEKSGFITNDTSSGFADFQKNVIGIGILQGGQSNVGTRSKFVEKGAYDNASFQSLLSHEVQHLIQSIDGFGRGGNKSEILDRLTEDQLRKFQETGELAHLDEATKKGVARSRVLSKYGNSHEAYRSISGEVESRNVQTRMNMTPEERLNTLLSETEDVSREDQIVLMEGLGVSNLESNTENSQWVIDQMESTAKVKDEITLMTVPEMADYLEENGFEKDDIDAVMNNPNMGGLMANERILINSKLTAATTLLTWAHEKAHRQIFRMMPNRGKRVLFLNDLYKTIGEQEINSVLPKEYKYESHQSKAQEYVSNMIEEYILHGKLPEQVKPEVKNFIFEVLNGFTTAKNIQDAKQSINLAQRWSKERNAPDNISERSGLQETSGNSGGTQIADSPSLRQADGRKEGKEIDRSVPLMNLLSDSKKFTTYQKVVDKIKSTPDDNNILFRRKGDRLNLDEESANEQKEGPSPQKVRSNWGRVISKFADTRKVIRDLINKFNLNVPDFADPGLALNQKSSRSMGQMNYFVRDYFNPIEESFQKIIKATGKSKEDIWRYMTQRHAPERNATISKSKVEDNSYLKDAVNLLDKLKKQHKALLDSGDYDVASAIEIKMTKAQKNVEETKKALQKKYAGEDDNYSGYTTKEAIELYEKFESEVPQELIDELWENTRKATARIQKYWVDYGRYKQEHIDGINSKYNWEYYVPLRGWEPLADDIELDYINNSEGEFAGNKKAEGRKSLADDPIAQIYNMANSVILWGEKNRVKRIAWNMVKINEGKKELFEMKQTRYMTDENGIETEVIFEPAGKYIDSKGNEVPDFTVATMNITDNGDIRIDPIGLYSELKDKNTFTTSRSTDYLKRRPAWKSRQHEVDLFIAGNQYKIIFKDPAVANAINYSNLSKAIPYLSSLTRYKSRVVTSLNPTFIIRNAYRDFWTGTTNMYINGGVKTGVQFMQYYFKAAKYLAKNNFNIDPKTEAGKKWKQYYDEFNLNGGPTGHAYLLPLDEVKRKISRDLKLLNRGASSTVLKYINPMTLFKAIESLSGYSEEISRFAAYSMSRDNGKSIISSINEAKEVTVNFDSKGELAPMIGSFIMFYNPTIQSGAKTINNFKNHPYRAGLVAGINLLVKGIAIAALWDLLNGDDDDKDYKDITDYTRKNNMVIGWDDNYAIIPLTQEYRAWYGMGVTLYDWINGKIEADDALVEMAVLQSKAYSPVEIGGFFDKQNNFSTAKTLGALFNPIQPLMDIQVNEDFKDDPIFRVPLLRSDDDNVLNSQMNLKSVNYFIKKGMDWLAKSGGADLDINSNTVGGKKISTWRDFNPSKVEHIARSFAPSWIFDASNSLAKAIFEDIEQKSIIDEYKTEGFDPSALPVVNSFWRKKHTGKTYEEYREVLNYSNDLKNEYAKRFKTFDLNKINVISSDQRQFFNVVDNIENQIQEIRAAKEKADSKELKEAADLNILTLRRSAIQEYRKLKNIKP